MWWLVSVGLRCGDRVVLIIVQQPVEVVDDFAGLHARVNLGGKWKGKKLTDEQKRYVLNLRKENHEDNVRVRKQKRARDKEAAQEAAATSKKGRRCEKKNRGFSVTCIRTGGHMPHANWLSS